MGLFIDRIREITGLVKVESRLVVTPLTMVPGIVIANQPSDAGDALGGVGQNDIDVKGRPLPQFGFIVGSKLIDPDDDTLSLTVHVYSAKIAGTTDDAALAHTAVDGLSWITSMGFDDGTDIGSAKCHEIQVWNSPFYLPNRTLYWQCSTAGTPNIAAGAEPRIQFFILPFGG